MKKIDGLPLLDVTTIVQNSENDILIAFAGDGIYGISSDNLDIKFKHYHQEDKAGTINGNVVTDIFIDNEKSIWVTSIDAGISYFNVNKPKFTIERHLLNNENSLSNNIVRAIAEDNKGNLWFGTENGINVFSEKNNKWCSILNKISFKNNTINKLAIDTKNNVWAVTRANEILRINKNDAGFQIKSFENDEDMAVQCLFADSDNEIWFTYPNSKIIRYSTLDNKKQVYTISVFRSIIELHKGELYFGGYNSELYVFLKQTNQFKKVLLVDVDGKPINTGVIVSLQKTSGNKIGIYLYNTITQKIEYANEDNTYFSTMVVGLKEDVNENLWIATQNGLLKFEYKTKTVLHFNEIDGISRNTFLPNANCYTSSGKMVFGTTNGLTIFRPEEIRKDTIRQNLVFTDFKLFYQSVLTDTTSSVLDRNIDDTKTVRLKYNQNSFSFEFVAINYTNANSVTYSWKLEGIDKVWSPQTTNNYAGYTNISPGKYTFRVKSTNNGIVSGINERTVIVIISPPIWKSSMAYVIYILLFAFVLYIIVKYQMIRIHKKHSEERIQFFLNAAHDIKTPISLIKIPLEDNRRENNFADERGKYRLELAIQNIEKLQRIISQLFDLKKLEDINVKLHVSEIDIVDFIKNRIEELKPQWIAKEIEIETSFPDSNLKVWFDKEKMNKIIENLLTNAIKYSQPKTNIKIRLFYDKKYWHLEIEDQGIGIPPKEQHKIFKLFYRAQNAVNSNNTGSGVGLILTKNLTKLHQGKISFKSIHNQGSTFRLSFLLGNTHFKSHEIASISESIIVNNSDLKPVVENEKLENIKLLIVDDNNELRQYLAQELKKQFSVIEAANGLDGIKKAQEFFPDIIISDVMMPELNGIEFCKSIKTNIVSSHIPIILISAHDEKQIVLQGLEAGAIDYLTKPFDLNILLLKINNILHSRKLFKEGLLAENKETESKFDNELDKEFIEKINTIIYSNISNPQFSVEMIAEKIGMARTTFYLKFKALVGQSTASYITHIRMLKAKELLLSQKYKINEIAFQLGFEEPAYFSTVFKNYYGVNPKNFQK